MLSSKVVFVISCIIVVAISEYQEVTSRSEKNIVGRYLKAAMAKLRVTGDRPVMKLVEPIGKISAERDGHGGAIYEIRVPVKLYVKSLQQNMTEDCVFKLTLQHMENKDDKLYVSVNGVIPFEQNVGRLQIVKPK